MNNKDAIDIASGALKELTSWTKSWIHDPVWRQYLVDVGAGRRDVFTDIKDLLESLKVS